ncbi:FecCD family ABC transporter permease [Bacillus horti]|uniref:Iron complex transport system permease protein n=1 Tax=Caldalkalibacillus horti TaxID=77523 RepID=A0ABT9VVG2_9BACI|nr:iron ABC transporter permease [Bacillus horti]MDQ0164973.1 iron complex transport system permease protein [Bacillus horti]
MGALEDSKLSSRRKVVKTLILLVLLIIVVFLISLSVGSIELGEVIQALIGLGSDSQMLIIYQFRLPRIVLAGLIGAGLAVAGAILQGISRNVLADPGVLGINAGAGLAVAAFSLAFSNGIAYSPFLMPFFALIGGLSAGSMIYMLAIKKGKVAPVRLILVGVGMSLICSALLILLQIRMDPFVFMSTTVWLAGSLAGTTWLTVGVLLPWILFLLPMAMYKARTLNILNMGDEVAKGLGVHVERQRLGLLAIAIMLASACVAVGGGISFVGLVAPHITRRLIGPKHEHLLPVSALIGALLLMIADILARQLLTTNEMPTGIIVSLVGAPYFLYLLATSKR